MKKRRAVMWAIVVVVVAGLAVRAVLPTYVENYVNRALANLESYEGRVGDVDLALWRGGVHVEDTVIRKRNGEEGVPFFQAAAIDLSIEWKALFKGALVGEIYLLRPVLELIQDEEEGDQLGEGVDWVAKLEELSPLRVNRLMVSNGVLNYRGARESALPELSLVNVTLLVTNLSNAISEEDELPSTLLMTARAPGGALAQLNGRFNMMTQPADMDMELTGEPVDLTELNPLIKRLTALDVERGMLGVYSEWAVKDAKLEGYLKLVMEDLEILDTKEDSTNPLALIWQSVADLFVQITENQREDQFASKIPISGDLSAAKAGVIPSLVSILENGFVQALNRDVDDSINLNDVKAEE